jgi:hypothetical protein
MARKLFKAIDDMLPRATKQLLLLMLLTVVVGSCSTDTSQGVVDGTVTLDGAPLATGIIRFVPADGQTATADAPISDGAFTAKVPIGEKRVTISAPKVVGKQKMYETPDSPTVDIVRELVPERYNVRSELTMTVQAGEQKQDFALTRGK